MLALVINHLWQSTVFAAAAGIVACSVGRRSARVRYWIWLAASLKFLVPFAALVAIGGQFEWRGSMAAPPARVVGAVDSWTQPFLDVAGTAAAMGAHVGGTATGLSWTFVLVAIWSGGAAALLFAWTMRWRRLTRIVRGGSAAVAVREEQILRRLEAATGARQAMAFVEVDVALEPGVDGVRQPTLLWPRQLGTRLSEAQIEAILAHELAHVRRRDNLTALLHMLVRAVFWFHPPVLWIGARLLAERERACDEDVIELGSDPQTYAEGVLKTCAFCLESPLSCVAGVTGSDLKTRIHEIMRAEARRSLSYWQKTMLAGSILLAVGGPVTVGALTAVSPQSGTAVAANQPVAGAAGGEHLVIGSIDGPSFEVVSVKPSTSGGYSTARVGISPDGATWTNNTLLRLIANAYRLRDYQVVGGPGWINSAGFDVVAKASGPVSVDRKWSMLRTLLAERFKVRAHVETRSLPLYDLVLARGDGRLGPQLRRSKVECGAPPLPVSCGFLRMTIYGDLVAEAGTIADVASRGLSLALQGVVVDRTGLAGNFDATLKWSPTSRVGLPSEGRAIDPPSDDHGSIFTAVEEQWGMKLVSKKGPVDVLVIDGVERPTPD